MLQISDPGSQTIFLRSWWQFFGVKSSIILWKICQNFFLQHFISFTHPGSGVKRAPDSGSGSATLHCWRQLYLTSPKPEFGPATLCVHNFDTLVCVRYCRKLVSEPASAQPGITTAVLRIKNYLDPVSGMNIPDHFSQFRVKNTKILCCGSGIILILDPGWNNSDPGSGINIPERQNCTARGNYI